MKQARIAILTILVLILSWNIPFTRSFWDILDRATFYFLNPLTGTFPSFVKFINSSLFDWLSDIVILVMMVLYFRTKDEKPTSKKIAEFIYIALIAAATIALVNKRLFPDVFGIKRVSPSLQLSPSIRLSAFFPGVKDGSHSCFPGDHATTAIFFVLAYFRFTSFKKAIPVFVYAFCMILPRLIIGAHWLTDVIMGSFCIALAAFTVAFGTPLHAYCVPGIEKMITGVSRLYGRFTQTFQQHHRS